LDLVCIQEIKPEDVQLSDIRNTWGNQSIDFIALKAQGSASGIIVMCDKNSFSLLSSYCKEFSVTCLLQMVGGDFTRGCTGV